MALTANKAKAAKPIDKPFKLSDGGGLYLLVQPNGSKYWRLDYRFAGKRKTLAVGVYPDVSLLDARDKRDKARKLLADGIDPGENKKAVKMAGENRAANSFEVVAREWHGKFSPGWAATHSSKIIRRLEENIFPWLGARPIAEITAPELLACIRRIEARGILETAHRTLQHCGQVFRYAVQTGRAERDPSGDLRGAIPPVKDKGHFAAVTEPKQVAELLRTLDGYQGSFVVSCALRLAPLVFVRPGELRKAEWADFDLDAAEWRYRVTKTKTDHVVPLSSQAVAILRELYALTGDGRYVFPGARSNGRAMCDNAVLAAMRRMGIGKDEMSGHGFRAMARTVLDEVLGIRPELIEHQLAHAVRDPLGRAYNRTTYLPERKKMMQQWADYLDGLKAGAVVLPFKKAE
jgi:integrase